MIPQTAENLAAYKTYMRQFLQGKRRKARATKQAADRQRGARRKKRKAARKARKRARR